MVNGVVNMWGSMLIGDEYDTPLSFVDELSNVVVKSISQHPFFEPDKIPIEKHEVVKKINKEYSFPLNGDGWLESHYGKDSDSIIRMFKRMRRHDKVNKAEYDSIIQDIRKIKALEVDTTLKSLSWGEGFIDTIKQLGIDNRDLKSLRKFGESRSTSLQKACQQFLKASTVLQDLTQKEDWNDDDKLQYVTAMEMRKDARKVWKNALHQIDNLTKAEKDALYFASTELEKEDNLSARELFRRGKDEFAKSMTANKMSSLLNMYGEEVNVYKGAQTGTFIKMGNSGFIIKDIWAYTAGFIDADGSIFISERGDPRVTIVASGDGGKAHCEELQKMLGCGRLVTDTKLAKNTVKPVHRLIFSSKDMIRDILKGVLPHLKLKSLQAKAVMSFIDEKDAMRKNELYQLVTFNNWKDDKSKAELLLNKWGLDADTIGGYAEGL